MPQLRFKCSGQFTDQGRLNMPTACATHCFQKLSPSEDHLVRTLVASQAEAGSKICLQILHLSDVRHQRLVDLLLVLYPLRVCLFLLRLVSIYLSASTHLRMTYLCSLSTLEELLLALTLLLLPCPVFVLADSV